MSDYFAVDAPDPRGVTVTVVGSIESEADLIAIIRQAFENHPEDEEPQTPEPHIPD